MKRKKAKFKVVFYRLLDGRGRFGRGARVGGVRRAANLRGAIRLAKESNGFPTAVIFVLRDGKYRRKAKYKYNWSTDRRERVRTRGFSVRRKKTRVVRALKKMERRAGFKGISLSKKRLLRSVEHPTRSLIGLKSWYVGD